MIITYVCAINKLNSIYCIYYLPHNLFCYQNVVLKNCCHYAFEVSDISFPTHIVIITNILTIFIAFIPLVFLLHYNLKQSLKLKYFKQ